MPESYPLPAPDDRVTLAEGLTPPGTVPNATTGGEITAAGSAVPVLPSARYHLLAEIARDRSLRLAPVDLADAREMIAEVRGLIPLAGYRPRRLQHLVPRDGHAPSAPCKRIT